MLVGDATDPTLLCLFAAQSCLSRVGNIFGLTGRFMKNFLSIVAMSAVLAIGASAHATEFIVNGDFTQLSNGVGQFDTNTVATGWSGNGGYNFVFSQADQASPGIYGGVALWDAANGGSNTWDGLAAAGGNFAALDGAFSTAALTQTITGLTPGKAYTLSFNYAFGQQQGFDGPTVQHLSLTFGTGGCCGTSDDFNVSDHGFTGWQFISGTVIADAPTDVISFLAYGNLPVPPFALISNVSLTGAVPEPATWTMMILGLGGLGALARRRRSVAIAA